MKSSSCLNAETNRAAVRRPIGIIGLNARFLAARISGVERYARCVSSLLIPLAILRNFQVKVFVPARTPVPEYMQVEGVEIVRSRVPRNPLRPWEQLALPIVAERARVDVLINLTNTAPVAFPRNILTLHDVAWMENPSWFSLLFRLGYNLIVPAAAKHALKVITVSKCSESEILKHLSVDRSRIKVIYEGVGAEFTEFDRGLSRQILQSYGLNRPYLLHVGTVQPRKNLERLIKAYETLSPAVDKPDLVLIGGRSGHFAAAPESTGADQSSIKWLGYVPDSDLPALYSQALAYVSASLYEGFNLTILEAMACGTPTVLSRIPPHLEVAGEDALFFDPTDESSVRIALTRICEDATVRAHLSERGPLRASRFLWQTHVASFMEVIEECVAATRE